MSTLIERARFIVRDLGDLPPEARETDHARMARVVVALDEALPGLRREHETACLAAPWNETQRRQHPEFGTACDCGADAHNATLDRLRKMLDEVTK